MESSLPAGRQAGTYYIRAYNSGSWIDAGSKSGIVQMTWWGPETDQDDGGGG